MNHDQVGKLPGDGQTSVAHLANEVGLPGEQLDALLLAEAEFAQPVGDLGGGDKLLYADNLARLDSAERTNLGSGAVALENLECRRRLLFHCGEARAIETQLQD